MGVKDNAAAWNEYQKAYMKARRAKHKAAGMCSTCGKRKPIRGRAQCAVCARRVAVNSRTAQISARDSLMHQYGGPVCVCCGETEILFLTLDHKNNDGAKHRASVYLVGKPNYAGLYSDLAQRGFPDVLQVMCFNCNCGRHRNKGVCPHKRA